MWFKGGSGMLRCGHFGILNQLIWFDHSAPSIEQDIQENPCAPFFHKIQQDFLQLFLQITWRKWLNNHIELLVAC